MSFASFCATGQGTLEFTVSYGGVNQNAHRSLRTSSAKAVNGLIAHLPTHGSERVAIIYAHFGRVETTGCTAVTRFPSSICFTQVLVNHDATFAAF